MKKHKLTPRSMNQDVHISNITPDLYFDARNIRIMVDDEDTGYVITNEDGQSLRFTVPDVLNVAGTFQVRVSGVTVDTISYTNSELSSAPNMTDLEVVGHCNLRDKIVLFTTSPANSGWTQIWLLSISNTGNITYELKYNNNLGITKALPIRKAIARYENDGLQRVYFTNNDRNLSVINIVDASVINLKSTEIEVVPDVTLSTPTLTAVRGGQMTAGVYQYAYRLYTANGVASATSPLSPLYPASEGIRGGALNENMGISMTLNITDIPEEFEIINVWRLQYTSLNQDPTVTLIKQEDLGSTSYTFTDDGVLSIAASSVNEVILSDTVPFTCKDMAVEDNILFPAGISYTPYDPDWDARAYRHDSGGVAMIKQADGSSIDAASVGYANVDEDHDAINPTNSVESTYRGSIPQTSNYFKYIYQSDGTTLGAEGANVSVELKVVSSTLEPSLNDVAHTRADNPYQRAVEIKGYKREEIYRFGIVLVNNKGQRSFAKWVCDIKMPNQETSTYRTTSLENGEVVKRHLYLTFTVANLPSDCVGWQVVRAQRNEEDKTILAQGIVNSTLRTPDTASYAGSGTFVTKNMLDYVQRTWHSSNGSSIGQPKTFKDNNTGSYSTSNDLNGEIDSDGTPNYGEKYKMDTSVLQLYSPEIEMNGNFRFVPGSYLNLVAGLRNRYNAYRYYEHDDLDNIISTNQNTTSVNYHTYNLGILSTTAKRTTVLIRRGQETTCDDTINVPILNEGVVVSENSGQEWTFNNIYTTKEFFNRTFVARRDGSNTPKMSMYGAKSLVFSIGTFNSSTGLETYIGSGIDNSVRCFIVADLKVALSSQYGGNTYEERQRTKYIPCGDLIPASTLSSDVYGGDTYIQLYSYLRTIRTEDNIYDGAIVEKILVPLETSINLDMRQDNENFVMSTLLEATDESTNYFDTYYDYNTVYSQENITRGFFPKPFNFTSNNSFDARVLHSDTKVNGEIYDSWSVFRPNNYLDLDYRYGAITGIYEYRDRLFVFQPEGICALIINPRPQVVSDGVNVELGTGTTLDRYEYISQNSGSINQWSVIETPVGLMYFDYYNNKISVMGTNPQNITDIKGMHSWLKSNVENDLLTDNPYNGTGVVTLNDLERNEVLYTFLQTSPYTLAFDSKHMAFKGFYGYTPNFYINNRNRIYSSSDQMTLYEHGTGDKCEFYGASPEESYITFMVRTKDGDVTNVFDTLLFNSDVYTFTTSFPPTETKLPFETVTAIRVWNDYQDSGKVNFTYGRRGNIIRKFREWRADIPWESGTRNRIRSQYCYITLYFDNSDGYHLNLQDIIVGYRVAPTSHI